MGVNFWHLIRDEIDQGGSRPLEQRLQRPIHPCTERLAREGLASFGRASETYEIEDMELRGPNVLSFQLVSDAMRWYTVGCYIPPTDLTTLTHVKQAWIACLKGFPPILRGDLNVNLAAPCVCVCVFLSSGYEGGYC